MTRALSAQGQEFSVFNIRCRSYSCDSLAIIHFDFGGGMVGGTVEHLRRVAGQQ